MADEPNKVGGDSLPERTISFSRRFAELNHLILRDLNNNRNKPTFYLYTKDDVQKFLTNPYQYEKQLRDAVIYIYNASSHFRRIIKYFVGLTDLAYLIEPYKIDPRKANVRTVGNNYRKCLNLVSSMSLKTQLPKILTICFREDVCYCTLWETADHVTIQILPSDYCAISTIEGNVPNVSFNFRYFDVRGDMLQYFPTEFQQKYEQYRKNTANNWIELDSPNSFAVKCNDDILTHAVPPFAGILRPLFDLEDYKQLKESQEVLENYAMLAMKLPMDDDGNWLIDEKKAERFWRNLDSVLPDEVGSVLSPMPIEKIDFDKSNTGDTDAVAEAEQEVFTAAGVSALLFNNEKASANALLLSIKNDQAMTYELVKHIQDALNRFIWSKSYGKNFVINFLNISAYNQKEMGDAYLKAASYGLPTISAYAATQGIGQAELDTMSLLEAEVLGLQEMFKPIISSTQLSSDELESNGATDEGGAPTKDIGEVSDSRESNSENE